MTQYYCMSLLTVQYLSIDPPPTKPLGNIANIPKAILFLCKEQKFSSLALIRFIHIETYQVRTYRIFLLGR